MAPTDRSRPTAGWRIRFGYTKEALAAHIKAIYYLRDRKHPNEEAHEQYERIQLKLPSGVRPLFGIPDPHRAKDASYRLVAQTLAEYGFAEDAPRPSYRSAA